jgi:hypothetical protein
MELVGTLKNGSIVDGFITDERAICGLLSGATFLACVAATQPGQRGLRRQVTL